MAELLKIVLIALACPFALPIVIEEEEGEADDMLLFAQICDKIRGEKCDGRW